MWILSGLALTLQIQINLIGSVQKCATSLAAISIPGNVTFFYPTFPLGKKEEEQELDW